MRFDPEGTFAIFKRKAIEPTHVAATERYEIAHNLIFIRWRSSLIAIGTDFRPTVAGTKLPSFAALGCLFSTVLYAHMSSVSIKVKVADPEGKGGHD